jgi:hypothetical protein
MATSREQQQAQWNAIGKHLEAASLPERVVMMLPVLVPLLLGIGAWLLLPDGLFRGIVAILCFGGAWLGFRTLRTKYGTLPVEHEGKGKEQW